MNDLVFVMYNLNLKQRQIRRESKISYDLDDEWITEKEGPTLPQDQNWLRNLDKVAKKSANLATEGEAEAEAESIFRDITHLSGAYEEDDEGNEHEDADDNEHQAHEDDEGNEHEDAARPSETDPDVGFNADDLW
jgi:hypothetical protein